MKHLIKFAMGAAIAGTLVNVLMKQARRRGQNRDQGQGANENFSAESGTAGTGRSATADDLGMSYGDNPPRGTSGYTVAELVADESSVGEGSGDDRVQLPDDGRVGRGTLNS
jgi:hypothetical protein